jgi:repressor LexA
MEGIGPMADFLTLRQKEILEYIGDFQRRQGVAPTHRDICERFGFSSYGTAYKHLRLLREKGFIERVRHQRRGMRLRREETDRDRAKPLRGVPFLGRIAAGQPIEVVEGDEVLSVPAHLLGAPRCDHFVLQVTGNSMIEEGVFDGDLVIVERRETAAPGEMVVALLDGEVTLKRYYPEDGPRQPADGVGIDSSVSQRRKASSAASSSAVGSPSLPMVRLQPANAAMAPLRVAAERVRVQGVVVGLMRKF